MQLTYQTATFSYVDDLTNPDALPVPVGLMLVGQAAGLRVLVVAYTQDETLDPFAQQLLEHLPSFVSDRVRAAESGANVGDIIAIVHGSLRNSLSVSKVSEPKTIAVQEPQLELPRVASLEVSSWNKTSSRAPTVIFRPLDAPLLAAAG